MILKELDPPFIICNPEWQSLPFVFSAPHSGRIYPTEFLNASKLTPEALRRSEDAYVEQLFSGVPELGAPLLCATFPRAYLDVNREPYELDQRLFASRLPSYANTRSSRVLGGLGTIPRVVGEGQEIYSDKLTLKEGLDRIEWLHKPYHRALNQLMLGTHQQFGMAVLFDCHSMPSTGLHKESGRLPDVILGNRFGTSCAKDILSITDFAFRSAGLTVVHNKPYAGGYITEHHGKPQHGYHALQIEIARSLYMDEQTLQPHAGFAELEQLLLNIISAIGDHVKAILPRFGLAAE